MFKCAFSSIRVSTPDQIKKGEFPYVLVRWPAHLELPKKIQDVLDERKILYTPNCNMNLPWTGAVVKSLRDIQEKMETGTKYSIGIDFDPEMCRVTGTEQKPYIQIDPTAVYLSKIEEIPSVWIGGTTTPEDDEYAKALNKVVAEASRIRFAKKTYVTPSGTPNEQPSADVSAPALPVAPVVAVTDEEMF